MEPLHYPNVKLIGNKLVDVFHYIGLFVIGAVVAWASWVELVSIYHEATPHIKDILLLFIYLELGAMIGIYFQTRRLPVRYLIYIAITALTRVLAIDVKDMADERMMTIAGAILMLCVAILVLRIGSDRFPARDSQEI